jgi:hypothetical protein
MKEKGLTSTHFVSNMLIFITNSIALVTMLFIKLFTAVIYCRSIVIPSFCVIK